MPTVSPDALQCQGFLQQLRSLPELVLPQRHCSQILERGRNARRISGLPSQCQPLLAERLCPLEIVALFPGHIAGPGECLQPHGQRRATVRRLLRSGLRPRGTARGRGRSGFLRGGSEGDGQGRFFGRQAVFDGFFGGQHLSLCPRHLPRRFIEPGAGSSDVARVACLFDGREVSADLFAQRLGRPPQSGDAYRLPFGARQRRQYVQVGGGGVPVVQLLGEVQGFRAELPRSFVLVLVQRRQRHAQEQELDSQHVPRLSGQCKPLLVERRGPPEVSLGHHRQSQALQRAGETHLVPKLAPECHGLLTQTLCSLALLLEECRHPQVVECDRGARFVSCSPGQSQILLAERDRTLEFALLPPYERRPG